MLKYRDVQVMEPLEGHAGIPQEYWKPPFSLSYFQFSISQHNTAVQQQQSRHLCFGGCNTTLLGRSWSHILPKPAT